MRNPGNPLSSRCTAKAKGSGQRCQQYVIGGGVCFKHGGAAKQVARARRDRVALAEALAADPRRSAATVLGDTVHSFDFLARRALQELQVGDLKQETVAAVSEVLDRAGRWAKTALDAQVDDRQARVAEAQVVAVAAAVQRAIVAEVPDAATRARLSARIRTELSALSSAPTEIEGT